MEPASPILSAKAELRREIRAALEKISPAVRAVESIDVCDRLERQLHSAHTLLFFAPLPDELDIWPLLEKFIAARKICALPAFDPLTGQYSARRIAQLGTDIVTGKFGVREPAANTEVIPLNRFDLILVPGMAFDQRGNRLGRGRGFYDQILSTASGIKCGVAYDFQIRETIPAEAHDMPVHFIMTPTRCVRRQTPGSLPSPGK